MGGFVADCCAASCAFVNYNVAALCVRFGFDWTEYAAAFICSVTGIDIYVKRTEAEGTMVARCVAEREHLFAAILADEAAIVFCKAFVFHTFTLFSNTEFREDIRDDRFGYGSAVQFGNGCKRALDIRGCRIG